MTIADLFQEIYKSTKEKLKYPIVTVYIIILILYNWDVLSYYFFSTEEIKDKIKYINTNFDNDDWRLFYPLCKAIVLTVLFPLVMWWLEHLLFYVKAGRRKLRNESNSQIREEKLMIAEHEFRINEARTGSKTILEWEDKVADLQRKIEIQNTTTKENIDFFQQKIKEKDDLIKQLKDREDPHFLQAASDYLKWYRENYPGKDKKLKTILGEFFTSGHWHSLSTVSIKDGGDENLLIQLLSNKLIEADPENKGIKVTTKGKNVYKLLTV